MFVRFRKLSNDGFEPAAAAANAFFTWERRLGRRRRRHWFIADNKDDAERLTPYRIKVMLVENTRVDGKVKQEIVAVLGSIDATWLESFWESAPDLARHQHWEILSLRARIVFWQGVLDRMSQIGDNRLSKDERVAIRRAIHKVVPWVMEPEKKRLELLEAQNEYNGFKLLHATFEERITRDEEAIARHTASVEEGKRESTAAAEQVFRWGQRAAELAKPPRTGR